MSKSHDNVIQFKKKVDAEHYVKAARTIVSSIIFGSAFKNQLEVYEKTRPEAIEKECGKEFVPYAFEMDIVHDVTLDILDDHVCNMCALEDSIEIDDPYVRRRVYRITLFLLQNWENVEKEASNIAAFKSVKRYDDEDFAKNYFLDIGYFDLTYAYEDEFDNIEEHTLN